MKQETKNTAPLLINPKEAAAITGLSTRTITRLCADGTFPAVRLGNSWRINRERFMQIIGACQA